MRQPSMEPGVGRITIDSCPRWGYDSQCMNGSIKFVVMLLTLACLTGCLEVKQHVALKEDGSGSTLLTLSVPKDMVTQALDRVKDNDPPQQWRFKSQEQHGDRAILVFERSFSHVSELDSDTFKFTFSTKRKWLSRETFFLDVQRLEPVDVPMEISVEMPGTVWESDGQQVSPRGVRWKSGVSGVDTMHVVAKGGMTGSLAVAIVLGVGAFGATLWCVFRKTRPQRKA